MCTIILFREIVLFLLCSNYVIKKSFWKYIYIFFILINNSNFKNQSKISEIFFSMIFVKKNVSYENGNWLVGFYRKSTSNVIQ